MARTSALQHTDVELTTESFTLKFGVDVPTAPVPLKDLLLVMQSLADAVIDRVERDSAAQGAPVSCRADCSFTGQVPRERESGGYGLGLAVVRRCITACRGTVLFSNRSGGGFVAEIELRRVG